MSTASSPAAVLNNKVLKLAINQHTERRVSDNIVKKHRVHRAPGSGPPLSALRTIDGSAAVPAVCLRENISENPTVKIK